MLDASVPDGISKIINEKQIKIVDDAYNGTSINVDGNIIESLDTLNYALNCREVDKRFAFLNGGDLYNKYPHTAKDLSLLSVNDEDLYGKKFSYYIKYKKKGE